jgi:hypothetical protein
MKKQTHLNIKIEILINLEVLSYNHLLSYKIKWPQHLKQHQ